MDNSNMKKMDSADVSFRWAGARGNLLLAGLSHCPPRVLAISVLSRGRTVLRNFPAALSRSFCSMTVGHRYRKTQPFSHSRDNVFAVSRALVLPPTPPFAMPPVFASHCIRAVSARWYRHVHFCLSLLVKTARFLLCCASAREKIVSITVRTLFWLHSFSAARSSTSFEFDT